MRRKRWMRRSAQAACALLAVALATQPRAQEGNTGAPAGSVRAAQDLGLDFSLRPVDLLNVDPGGAPPGSYRAAQDIGRNASSSPYGDRWSAEGYQGPWVPPPWAGGRDQPLDSRTRF
jgi:hypothetical protein